MRLACRLRQGQLENRLVLVVYLPAGYPSREQFTEAVRQCFASGADCTEISLPGPASAYDGAVIRDAAHTGSTQITDPAEAAQRAAAGRTDPTQPIILLAHRTAFDALGGQRVIEICAQHDIDAIMLPEHSVSEQIAFAHHAGTAGLDQVIFVANVEEAHLVAHGQLEPAIIYLPSGDIRTGGRFNPRCASERLVRLHDVLAGTAAYVMLGFGIQGPEETAEIAMTSAAAVVIGTAAIRAIQQGPSSLSELITRTRSVLPKPDPAVDGASSWSSSRADSRLSATSFPVGGGGRVGQKST